LFGLLFVLFGCYLCCSVCYLCCSVCYLCCSVVICVVRLLFVLYVLFVCKCVLPSGDNPIAVNKYIIKYHMINNLLFNMHSMYIKEIVFSSKLNRPCFS